MATTKEYLDSLLNDKQNLVDNLNAMKVAATSDETFSSLVPKVLQIQSGLELADYMKYSDLFITFGIKPSRIYNELDYTDEQITRTQALIDYVEGGIN